MRPPQACWPRGDFRGRLYAHWRAPADWRIWRAALAAGEMVVEVAPMREFLRSFAIQRRVLGALIMRETYTRYGRDTLGFAWLFGEFLIFAMPVLVMWHFLRGKYEHGLLVVPFAWSGYLPILLFRHIGGHALRGIRLNLALLYHRNVTPFDVVAARMIVEIAGNYGAAIFSFFVLMRSARWTGRRTCRCSFSATPT